MSNAATTDAELPFMSHLLELRDRLLRAVLVVLVVFLALFPFGNDIYHFIAEPLMAVMPDGTSMIATKVASPFLTPFKLSLIAAVFVSMPYLLYQLWGFVAPGLYAHEKRMAMPLLASSVVLFYLGAAFAYYVVFPLVFRFFTSVTPEGVAVMTDISEYLDFVLTLFFAFGLAFEIPIATILLVWMGMTTPEKLARKRPYVVVGVFVIGMLLTPPDIISQTLLALPMWVLFEAGIIFSRFFVREQEDDENESEDEVDGEAGVAAAATPAGASVATPPVHTQAEESDFQPLSDAEMEAELDRLEAEMDAEHSAENDSEEETASAEKEGDSVDRKLVRVNQLRDAMDFDAARKLLYEVLVEGNENQVLVARNILSQLDDE
ncbi:twin-arginine translocase subunit TatC [Thiolapillus brandeum]|uniref:Sec-independent protein translocase protein TatC n=1 Tax=Thiolapillus brandeum TaxID=1076588 RepID=A0A7U6GHB5_9GAMM|nr:twin-arginine translocase subunit TatC [Thiolapillus brandeum]BAO43653.1 twin-arginine translocation system component TatC [Thiolapillus brandeum]